MDLHERLSEFSYGYGVTREFERLLGTRGLRAVPFLPSLIQEAGLGFDVGFRIGRTALVVQFKLGHELLRYHRKSLIERRPPLSMPFWRYDVDTSADQFQHMLRYDVAGAFAVYAAPKFSSWQLYARSFLTNRILSNSLLASPSDMLIASGKAGPHQVLYDTHHAFIRSDPQPLPAIPITSLIDSIAATVDDKLIERQSVLATLYSDRVSSPVFAPIFDSSIFELAQSADDAVARILGWEAWLQGAQLILVGR